MKLSKAASIAESKVISSSLVTSVISYSPLIYLVQ
jgi:hypothetical protein